MHLSFLIYLHNLFTSRPKANNLRNSLYEYIIFQSCIPWNFCCFTILNELHIMNNNTVCAHVSVVLFLMPHMEHIKIITNLPTAGSQVMLILLILNSLYARLVKPESWITPQFKIDILITSHLHNWNAI